jgi:mitochondrial fission protein ELM1
LKAPIQITILSDGKAGHENQCLGLVEAMGRRTGVEYRVLRLDIELSRIARLYQAIEQSRDLPKPDFVVSAGSSTHLALLLLSRKYKARSIVLMKPTLPMAWFEWCIAPEHDFKKAPNRKRLITSKGALNRVVPAGTEKSGRLLLIGGPSKTHGYDEAGLVEQIRRLVADGGDWQLTNSRRTPETFLTSVKKEVPGLELFPHEQTPPGWLAERLSEVEEVRVTEDSVSMVYEALTGGAKVGLLKMPRLKTNARVIRGLDTLENEGYFIGSEGEDPPRLAEADRCAAIILDAEK